VLPGVRRFASSIPESTRTTRTCRKPAERPQRPGGAGNWYTDENHHGTHVAGTIAALNNALGVVGVTPNGYLNVFIVKVFDAEGWAYSSTLVDALNRCVAGKTTGSDLIVSMSLGGSLKSRFEETAFGDAYASKNVLSVAAAGNDGNSRYSYPASYSSVISWRRST
jgi:subtilisin family serine protease